MIEISDFLNTITAVYHALYIWIWQIAYAIQDIFVTWSRFSSINYIIFGCVASLLIILIIILSKRNNKDVNSEHAELTEEEAKTYLENYRRFKEVCKEIIDDLKEMDPAKRSRRSRENATNWVSGISAATLIALVGNFNKFLVPIDSSRSFMPYKALFLLAVLLLGISTFLLVYSRKLLYEQRIKIDESLDFINIIPDIQEQMNRENSIRKEIKGANGLSEEEIIKIELKILENTWNDESCNCISHQKEIYRTYEPFKWGYRFYICGLMTSTIYILIFIYNFID